jgi:hypothetical protein
LSLLGQARHTQDGPRGVELVEAGLTKLRQGAGEEARVREALRNLEQAGAMPTTTRAPRP